MKDPDIEQLLKDGKGYDLNLAHVLEFLMARTIANSFLSSEIIKRQIELEQLIMRKPHLNVMSCVNKYLNLLQQRKTM